MDVRVNVERGELADVPGAQAVLAEARQWLADRSIDQWRDPLPDRVIEEDVRRGRLFVVRADGGLAGMLSIAHSDGARTPPCTRTRSCPGRRRLRPFRHTELNVD